MTDVIYLRQQTRKLPRNLQQAPASKMAIYVLNRDLFSQYSIFEYEVEHPENPDEKEVTIRAEDCGCIPEEVIIAKELIEIN